MVELHKVNQMLEPLHLSIEIKEGMYQLTDGHAPAGLTRVGFFTDMDSVLEAVIQHLIEFRLGPAVQAMSNYHAHMLEIHVRGCPCDICVRVRRILSANIRLLLPRQKAVVTGSIE